MSFSGTAPHLLNSTDSPSPCSSISSMSRTIIRPLSTHDCGQNRGQENIHLTAIVTAITKSAHLHMAHIFSHTRVQRASFRDKAPLSRIQRDRIITAERGIWQQRQGTELPRNCTCCQITRKPRRVIPVRGCSSIRCPRWDSNPHCTDFEAVSSTNWDTGAFAQLNYSNTKKRFRKVLEWSAFRTILDTLITTYRNL